MIDAYRQNWRNQLAEAPPVGRSQTSLIFFRIVSDKERWCELSFSATIPYLRQSPRAGVRAARHETITVQYRTEKIDGLDIFYRAAGPADAPTSVLLHGLALANSIAAASSRPTRLILDRHTLVILTGQGGDTIALLFCTNDESFSEWSAGVIRWRRRQETHS